MKDYSVGRSPDELHPFFPHQVMREAMLSLLLIALQLGMVLALPEGSQKPQEGQYVDHPAESLWYFYPLFKLKRVTGGWTGALLISGAAVLITLAVPFLERSKERALRKRPFSLLLLLLLGIGLLALLYQRAVGGFS